MKTIDQQKFEHYVSAATNAQSTIFDMLGDYIDVAESWLQHNILGSGLKVDDLNETLMIEAERFICLYSFYNAIPELDLILTDNGFGVVNNDNVSPASADRVDKLRKQVLKLSNNALDCIIDGLRGNALWDDSALAHILISSTFYKADHLSTYAGMADATRLELANYKTSIFAAENKVVKRISLNLFKYILEGIRHDDLKDVELDLLDSIRCVVGFHLSKDLSSEDVALDDIENFLESNLDAFPLYMSSNEYKVKHYEHFQNAKDDSTYFF